MHVCLFKYQNYTSVCLAIIHNCFLCLVTGKANLGITVNLAALLLYNGVTLLTDIYIYIYINKYIYIHAR